MSQGLEPFTAYLVLRKSYSDKDPQLGIRMREEGYSRYQLRSVADTLAYIHRKRVFEMLDITPDAESNSAPPKPTSVAESAV